MQPLVFDIQRYAVHNGPGIRTTVFLKGCPLSCVWCHNPESQKSGSEFFYHANRCLQCGTCQQSCPTGACTFSKSIGCRIDVSKCTFCEKCTDNCPTEAISMIGRQYTVRELMHEIEKDQLFFETSGGGVTFSGGEAMIHIDYLEQLLQQCKRKGIHTAIDTCGHVPFSYFERIIPFTDLFLYDVKCIDANKHKAFTGCSNELILANLVKLSALRAPLNIRVPLIHPLNTSEADIRLIIEFLSPLNINSVSLLPFHQADYKYHNLGKAITEYKMQKTSEEQVLEIRQLFEKQNYTTRVSY